MLLNEFLKEHRKVEQQQATIGRLETTAAKQETKHWLKSNVSPLDTNDLPCTSANACEQKRPL